MNQSPDVSVSESFLHQHNPFIQDRNNLQQQQPGNFTPQDARKFLFFSCFFTQIYRQNSTDDGLVRGEKVFLDLLLLLLKNIERFRVEID